MKDSSQTKAHRIVKSNHCRSRFVDEDRSTQQCNNLRKMCQWRHIFPRLRGKEQSLAWTCLPLSQRGPSPKGPSPRDPSPRDPSPRGPSPRDPSTRGPSPRDPSPSGPSPSHSPAWTCLPLSPSRPSPRCPSMTRRSRPFPKSVECRILPRSALSNIQLVLSSFGTNLGLGAVCRDPEARPGHIAAGFH